MGGQLQQGACASKRVPKQAAAPPAAQIQQPPSSGPHQFNDAGVKHNLHLVLILPAAQHQVAGLQVTVNDGVGLPTQSPGAQQVGMRHLSRRAEVG